ncbi:MAG: DUF4198 domain-containing protein [Thermoanaerobaculia bacterium]
MRRGAVLVTALVAAAPLYAHDFWIEPSSFRPAVGSTVSARLFVGQKFRGDPVPRNPALIEKFVLVTDAGETPVEGRLGDDPAGRARVVAPGIAVIGYRSRDSFLSQEADKFEDYLHEEGLERILELRARRGESAKPSREVFSRCAKALVSSGGGSAGYDRNLGLTLELLPEKNPYLLRVGQELPIRLLYEQKPLSGALVVALPYDAPDAKLSQRTDRKGRVRLRLPASGRWLVKAVHMVPASDAARADWQSLWASLTFEIPGADPVGKAP